MGLTSPLWPSGNTTWEANPPRTIHGQPSPEYGKSIVGHSPCNIVTGAVPGKKPMSMLATGRCHHVVPGLWHVSTRPGDGGRNIV